MKKWQWAPFTWMVDVVPQNVWVLNCVNKDRENKSLPLLAFQRDVFNAIFLKYSKEDRSSMNHVGIRNVLSDARYDNTKHLEVPSEKQGRCNVCKRNSPRCCVKC